MGSMKLGTRALAAPLVAALAVAGCSAGTDPGRAKAEAVIARSKALRSTYAVYNLYRIPKDNGSTVLSPSAEYNDGARHRVEAPANRIISDCDTGKGVALDVPTGRTTENEAVAKAACGVSTVVPFDQAEWLGLVDTPYGKADRIRVVASGLVRTYDIDKDGVIVWSRVTRGAPEGPVVLDTRAVVLRKDLPSRDMFDRASLQKSFFPADVLAELQGQAGARR